MWRHFFPLMIALVLIAGTRSGFGQEPPAFPFAPDKMFEQFFGRRGIAEVDDAELAKIEIGSDEEQKLGRQALDDLRRQLKLRKLKLVENGDDVRYLSRIVEIIRPQMTQAHRYRKLDVYLLESNDPDAYTLPGGHVLFSRGLLDAAQCEAALVAVAGHELAHLDRGHLLRRARQWKLAQKAGPGSGGAFTPEKMMQSVGLMQKLFQRPFGPEEELDADRDGIVWAYRAGYDPRAVELIYAAIEKRQAGGANWMPAFFRTHPQSAERRENLAETLAALMAEEPQQKLYLGRENLARRQTRKQKEFDE